MWGHLIRKLIAALRAASTTGVRSHIGVVPVIGGNVL